MNNNEIMRNMKWEKMFGWIYLSVGLISIIGTQLLSSSFDNGSIRYGFILPVFFFWKAHKCYKNYKDLKLELKE